MTKITINKDEICPCAVILALLSSKWKILIIRELLLSKSQRYNSLKKKIVGIS
ncbi:winged helix-turn-helix transcriptional regulator [Limosilactobacillus reuteri]|nr:winged helix-turn-helix transcriptional regulator [Limosilactobacillus reuteri]